MINKEKIIESLSPNERKILPFLEENIVDISKKSNLDNFLDLERNSYSLFTE